MHRFWQIIMPIQTLSSQLKYINTLYSEKKHIFAYKFNQDTFK